MKEGFFTKKETEFVSHSGGKIHSCNSCGLQKKCNSPKMEPYGKFKKGILNIGEAPGEIEDARGKPWQGRTGRLLQETYQKLGIDLFEDCLNINAVRCCPVSEKGENRSPTSFEIECCRSSILKIIQQYKPKIIVLFGNVAVQSLIGHLWGKELDTITKWRGWTIPDQTLQTWIIPTFHPSYVERSLDNNTRISVEKTIWMQDLKLVKEYLSIPFLTYKEPKIEIIEDLTVLNRITSKFIAIDFETTGIKPHAEGHRIVSCAVADSEDHCYVFLIPQYRKERKPLLDLLGNPKIRKFGHNIKYEDTWSIVRLGQEIVNWELDTMLMAHILDNRPKITGLKFQTYVNFGVADYSSRISPYLQVKDSKSANSFNAISELINSEANKALLLEYNGLDAIFTFRLAMKQQRLIEYANLPF